MNIHVTLLGREALPVYYPIKQYRPDKVYIIGTSDNRAIAERLRMLLTEGQKSVLGNMHPLLASVEVFETSAFDLSSTINICNAIHERHPAEKPENFTYNVTGGTKVMTIAAFEVAKERGAGIIYTDSKSINYLLSSEPDIPLDCDIKTPEIIALQGQIIGKADRFDKNKDKTDIEAAKLVFEFWKKNRRIYTGLRLALFGSGGKDNISIPNNFWFDASGYQYHMECTNKSKQGHRRLLITNDFGDIFLEIRCKDPKSLLFKGVWWELVVAASISAEFPDYPIWRNVEFQPVEGARFSVKNEVDILVNIGNKLLFVECKSGRFDNAVIHKMSTVRKTFGGEKSKSVLVSAISTNGDQYQQILENAKDNSIAVLSPDREFADDKFLSITIPAKIRQFLNKNTI